MRYTDKTMKRYAKWVASGCALTCWLLTGGCVSVLDEDLALTRIPYTLQADGRIVIQVSVNDQGPFAFALDTAASISAISKRLVNELELAPASDKKVFVQGAIGSGEFDLVNLRSLTFGSEHRIDKGVVVLPGTSRSLRGLDGILGLDILRSYPVGFAVRQKAVLLYGSDSIPADGYRGWSAVPMVKRPVGDTGASVYAIGMKIRGHKFPAILDLGAEVNVVNNAAASLFGLKLQTRNSGEFSGALDSAPILANLSVAEVTTRFVTWIDEEFSVIDLPVFETFDMAGSPAAIVGARLLTQRDLVIDFPRERLLIKNSMEEHAIGN